MVPKRSGQQRDTRALVFSPMKIAQ